MLTTTYGPNSSRRLTGDVHERNMDYARELTEQMHIQETRKTLEPYLMSRPERQMNAALLRRLPSSMGNTM